MSEWRWNQSSNWLISFTSFCLSRTDDCYGTVIRTPWNNRRSLSLTWERIYRPFSHWGGGGGGVLQEFFFPLRFLFCSGCTYITIKPLELVNQCAATWSEMYISQQKCCCNTTITTAFPYSCCMNVPWWRWLQWLWFQELWNSLSASAQPHPVVKAFLSAFLPLWSHIVCCFFSTVFLFWIRFLSLCSSPLSRDDCYEPDEQEVSAGNSLKDRKNGNCKGRLFICAGSRTSSTSE